MHVLPGPSGWAYNIWVVVKIRVPFWILNIRRHLIFRVPKKGHNFDNYPYSHHRALASCRLSRTRYSYIRTDIRMVVQHLLWPRHVVLQTIQPADLLDNLMFCEQTVERRFRAEGLRGKPSKKCKPNVLHHDD